MLDGAAIASYLSSENIFLGNAYSLKAISINLVGGWPNIWGLA